ncbi:MAG: hypothetical protein DRJ03_04755 [Chloroflexi bacterium]|nr:MAG: hypothetical protein DRI81_04015 [Chloroflexota bacterium]RLC87814.1 MAG: hypothetical protein DRJ03_04755 [Chloroflexota bacterium]
MSEPIPTTTGDTPQAEPIKSSRRSCLLLIPIAGGILLLLIAGALMLYLGIKSVFFKGNPGMPLEVVKVTPTPFASPVPIALSCQTIIGSDDVQVAVPLPISLTVASEPLPITPIMPEQAGWTYPSDSSGSATWICGTVVNYVLGLKPTPDNEALLTNLRPGDEIKLHLSNGVVLFFRFVEQREAAANEATVFEQFRPRLTLILEMESGGWQVATADYVAETEPVQPPQPGTQIQLGQPVRVGDAQVTVNRGHAESGGEGQSAETMYYLVEFSVENVGAAPLDAGGFTMQLQDGVGNQYLLSPAASSAGEHGPLSGEIAPGDTVQGTAGYVAPKMLAGPTLTWTFNPRPGSELRASVSIPYEGEGGGAEPAPGQAEVRITDAFLNSAGDKLNIEGEVSNVGNTPLIVEFSDISLTSSSGMGELILAAPPLTPAPWTIEPGQTQVIELQYARPEASTALLALLGYSFEIQGLQ